MKLILFIALLLPFAWGCKKKTTGSNDNSSSYANSFTCEVNGQEWVAQSPGGPNNPPAVSAEFYSPTRQITVAATLLTGNKFQKIWLFCDSINDIGTYQMEYTSSETYGFYDHYPAECGVYYYENSYLSTITLTEYNQQNHHISGTFQMNLTNHDCSDSILTITNGHFSTYYQ